jgi:hypothetical protein
MKTLTRFSVCCARTRSRFLRFALAIVLAAAAVAGAEELDADSPLGREMIARERETWELYRARDVAGLAAITAEDFRDIYPDGTLVTKAAYLADVPTVDVESYTLDRFHVIRVTETCVVLAYEARAKGRTPRAGEIESEVAVTSLWARRDGRWVNVFYRENVLALNGRRLLPPATSVAATPPIVAGRAGPLHPRCFP